MSASITAWTQYFAAWTNFLVYMYNGNPLNAAASGCFVVAWIMWLTIAEEKRARERSTW